MSRHDRSRSLRPRPGEPLRRNHRQDHRRAGGRPRALGPALGNGGGEGAARHAEERRHRPVLFRDQRADPLGRGDRARLSGPELADVSPSARRLAATSARASAAPPSSMPTASFRMTRSDARERPARKRKRSRSSSASPYSTWRNAKACRQTSSSPHRRRSPA